MNIALFGTSADPPTRGHGKILTWLAQHYDQVAVWAADNPFKQHHASLDHRNAMLQTLVNELSPKNISFLSELSYRRSVMTVAHAHELWPEAELNLVIGSDLAAQLPSWYESQSLIQQAKLLIVPRPGTPLGQEALNPLLQMGAQITVADMEGLDVSSTAYRECGGHEQGDHPQIISPAVEAYIDRTDLYDCDKRRIRQLPPCEPAPKPPHNQPAPLPV